jgi:hypothetical protein
MAKKKAKKLKSAGTPSTEKLKAPAQAQTEAEEKFNYGGLPNIDLKKNLGCG